MVPTYSYLLIQMIAYFSMQCHSNETIQNLFQVIYTFIFLIYFLIIFIAILQIYPIVKMKYEVFDLQFFSRFVYFRSRCFQLIISQQFNLMSETCPSAKMKKIFLLLQFFPSFEVIFYFINLLLYCVITYSKALSSFIEDDAYTIYQFEGNAAIFQQFGQAEVDAQQNYSQFKSFIVYSCKWERYTQQQKYYMSEDLLSRLQKDQYFKNEVAKNQQNYKELEQAAAYSETKHIPARILKKVPNKDIYLYFGYMQPLIKKDMRQVAMYLINNFKPQKNKPYTLVFFNENTKDNYVLWNFRQTFSCMKIEDIALLKQFIVVKPYFYHKTMDWMTFGVIPKFIKGRTKFIYSYKQLCEHLECNLHMLTENVPGQLYKNELPQLYTTTQELSIHRINIEGQSRTQQQKAQMLEFQKSIMSMIMKPGNEINNLEDYEISPEGVPNILKMLVFYFDAHKQGLQLQGIFRKSVSIDEQKQTIHQILEKNYDYLLQIQNPHIIANLIKRFFSTLKIPVFPFASFMELMNDAEVHDKISHLKSVYDAMPELNKTTLTFIFYFFKEKLLKYEHLNKMNAQNIAICFAPCIFRSQKPSMLDLMFASKGVLYCKLLLTESDKIFGTKAQQEQLYRHSYLQKSQKFKDNLKVGMQLTLINVKQQNQPAKQEQQRLQKMQKIKTVISQNQEQIKQIEQKKQQQIKNDEKNEEKEQKWQQKTKQEVDLSDMLLNVGAQNTNCRHSREVNLPEQQYEQFQQMKQDSDPKDIHEQKHAQLELKQQ